MTSSHDEDLIFFGESLATVEEGAPKQSFLQKARLDWKGKSYLLEADYDWEEKSVCTCLFRNDSLILYQPAEFNPGELNLPLGEQVQTALHRERESLQAAFRLTQLVSEDWRLLNGLGLFFYSQNLWPEAEEFLLGAIQRRSDYSEAYQNLSQVYLKMGLPGKSVELLEQAVKLNPGFADLHNALGWVYLECDRHQDARKQLESALQLNPNYQEAHLNTCLSFLQTAEHSQADHNLPAPPEAVKSLKRAASQDSTLSQKVQKISSWEDVSRQYLILKDKQSRRDTTNLRADCELVYARLTKDRKNLPEVVLSSFITRLEDKINRGYNYADLRNYLGTFYLFWATYWAERAQNHLQNQAGAAKQKANTKQALNNLQRIGKSLVEVSSKLEI